MKIHKEGYPTILIALALIGLINFLSFNYLSYILIKISALLVSLIFFYLILHFFRNPTRDVKINNKHIIAPSDGKLVVVEEVFENEFLKEDCTQLSIFMSPLNVHKQWYPVNGEVIYSKNHDGKYLVAWHPKSSSENERSTIVIQTKENQKILFRQIAGAVARRICNYSSKGDKVDQNMEAGFIKFGSRIDVFIPKSSKIKVSLNDIIIGGETVLAEM
ncbi:MAG: phosphatidylserine decarboxylase family protein [Flavobacteriales bacterium]|jgi:phosphatidylserine decarboxylase|tara:strand:+ start:437 stop:1090 length:654 start_codon:yes stop_codon:yes gene_type:complete